MRVKYVHEISGGAKGKGRMPLSIYEERDMSPEVIEILRDDEEG